MLRYHEVENSKRVWDILNSATKRHILDKIKELAAKNAMEEFPDSDRCPIDMISDACFEVAYESWAGKDGNWFEFTSDWGLTDQDMVNIKVAMTACGWTSEKEEW